MILNLRKKIVIFLSLILGFYNISTDLKATYAVDNKTVKSNNLSTPRMQNLFKNDDWKKLSKIWKKYNHAGNNTLKAKIQEFLNESNADQKSVNIYLESLKRAKLLTKEEQIYLKKVINERINFIQYEKGLVLCYEMSQIGMEVVKKREDLEKQYDILEKMFNEKKINKETYKNAVSKINEDMKFIQKNSSIGSQEDTNKQFIDLIVQLNR